MVDLKSCPFCGGEATHRRFTGNGFTLARVEYTQVSCQKCRIETEPDQPLSNEDRAATAWNRRTLQAVGPEPVAVRELHGPYGWLNGHRALSEDSWELENDPLENSDEYFAIPLYALTDPFAEIGKDGPRSALVATPPAEARLSEALRKIIEKADLGTSHGLSADFICEEIAKIARAALSGSGSGWWLIPNGEPVTLDDCPEGLFLFNGYLGFMTEYATDKNDGFRQRDAYCVDSGEYFWGGTSNARERAKLIVQPMLPAAPQQGGE